MQAVDPLLDPASSTTFYNLGILPVGVVQSAADLVGLAAFQISHHFENVLDDDGNVTRHTHPFFPTIYFSMGVCIHYLPRRTEPPVMLPSTLVADDDDDEEETEEAGCHSNFVDPRQPRMHVSFIGICIGIHPCVAHHCSLCSIDADTLHLHFLCS